MIIRVKFTGRQGADLTCQTGKDKIMCHSLPKFVYEKFAIKDHKVSKPRILSHILRRKKTAFIANFRQALRELSDDFDTSIADNLSETSTSDFVLAVGDKNMFFCYPSKNIEYKIKGYNVALDNRAIGMLATRIALKQIVWSCGKTTVDYYADLDFMLRRETYKPLQRVIENRHGHDLKTLMDCTVLCYYFEAYNKAA